MPPSHRPTLRTLAAEAGVSVTTMSFALRDSSEVSVATRERLQKLAKARGYRSNPLVTTLLSQVRRRKLRGDDAVIAYINTWWPRPVWETCNTKSGQFRGAARRATELGFRLQNFWLREPGMTPTRLVQILKARGIRGLLVGPLQDQNERVDLPWDDFTVATVGYSLHEPEVPRACPGHFRGMHRAMTELIDRGYRRIAYVTSTDFEDRVSSLWGAAYRFSQQQLSAANRIEPLVFEAEADERQLGRWIKAERPDAVVNSLPQVFEMLTSLRVRIPDELGFVHLDLPNHLKESSVCGIDQLSEHVGAAALDLVASQLFTNTRGIVPHPVTQLVEGAWLDGSTLSQRTAPLAKRFSSALAR